ncbi:hypothetical protein HK405_009672, partial [Cladochytrium tenue]
FVKKLIPIIADQGVIYESLLKKLDSDLVDQILAPKVWVFSVPTRQAIQDIMKNNSGVDLRAGPDPTTSFANNLEKAFVRSFDDPDGYLAVLKSDLEEYAGDCGAQHYFPGVAIIQASGSGKSRAVMELTKQGLYVVYCSFMPAGWSGFPRRSTIANSLLDPFGNFETYFMACYDCYVEYKYEGKSAAEFLESHTGRNQDDFWELIKSKMKSYKGDQMDRFKNGTKLELLFVFDEAGQMNDKSATKAKDSDGAYSKTIDTAFLRMIRASMIFKTGNCRAFVVLMDTTSRIVSLSPAAQFDRSKR